MPLNALDATASQPSVWAAVLGGAGLGLTWGFAARIWMRLIATTPEFSIAGTAAILIITTVFGAWVGLAYAARRRGWRGWRHYVPRGLVVLFFLPFGIAGGLPLMLTVLVATLGITQHAVVGLWVLAALVALVTVATDVEIPTIITASVPVGAIVLTVWAWRFRRPHGTAWWVTAYAWLDRSGRAVLLLLAAFGLWTVAAEIMAGKPLGSGLLAIFCYLLLLYPLFLALGVGLKPRAPAMPRAAIRLESAAQ
jgi:hypothetical protein